MFARNGSSLSSFVVSSRVVPANRGSYNRPIAEESRYNKDVLGAEAGQL